MTISCAYRVHPNWEGFDGDIKGAINELGRNAAASMGRRVQRIEQLGSGYDKGGYYVDLKVTYSSTEAPRYEELTR